MKPVGSQRPRDFVGYGAHPVDPRWPGGARLAVNFVINYEEGSEYSVLDGDEASEATLTDLSRSPVPRGERDLAAESLFEFGSRVGFWRIMRLFAERSLPATIFACALALERNPDAARAIAASGHDVCCHGWRWVEHYRLSEAEERAHITKAVASLARTPGERPLGWYCRSGSGINTRRLISEDGGFLYDSGAYNDELPYWVIESARAHLVLPYTLNTNDSKFARGTFAQGEDFYQYVKSAFDLLYAEGADAPKMMSVGLHLRIIGHPARASGLARLLDYVKGFDDVWITRRLDIARHWIGEHPCLEEGS